MFTALLHNVARLYVFKPWNNAELLQNIEKLFSTAEIINSPVLAKSADSIAYHVEIPDSCRRMLDFIEKEDLDSLIAEIEKDPEISALLMHVAKCSIYGAMPNSVRMVANYMGLHNLKSFMYWACVTVTDSKADARDNELAVLWKQSCDTNRILLFLYEAFLHKQPPEGTLLAGLLKNIGYIILLRSNISKENDQLKPSEENTKNLVALEMEKYKIFHQEIGAYYLNQWDLPYPAVEVALYHHRPLDSNIVNTELLACVHIAQYYSWKVLNGGQSTEFQPEVFDRIGITEKDFETKLAKYLK
jgi:HD-like signal output (HDOD) protein